MHDRPVRRCVGIPDRERPDRWVRRVDAWARAANRLDIALRGHFDLPTAKTYAGELGAPN